MVSAKNIHIQWLRITRRVVVAIALLFAVLILLLWLAYQWLPVRALQWSGAIFTLQQVQLAELSFQTGKDQQWWDVRIRGLLIEWRGWPVPSIKAQQLQLAPLLISAQATEVPVALAPGAATDWQIPGFPQLSIPGWVPAYIEIAELGLQLPCQDRPQQCQLQGALQSARQADQTTVDIAMHGDGQQVRLQLALFSTEQLVQRLNISQLAVQLDIKALADAGWVPGLPSGLVPETIQLQLTGDWRPAALQLELLQPLLVGFSYRQPAAAGARLQVPAAELRFSTGQLSCLQSNWQQCQLKLAASAVVRKLAHPQLQTSDWTWQGQAMGSLVDLHLSGAVENPQSLKVSYKAQLSPTALSLQWQLADMFLLAGNPLQISKLWPQLLELQAGKISAQGEVQVQLPAARLQQLKVVAALNELKGIYDRTAFSGLTADIVLEGDPGSFVLQLPQVQLAQLQQGFTVGPARLAAIYRADWATPQRGEVRLTEAQMGIFGGQLSIAPVQFTPEQQSIELQLKVQQIQLAALLLQHPSAQLRGEGIISGTIPLRYQQVIANQSSSAVVQGADANSTSGKNSASTLAQWQVLGGHLQAEPPGGRLQYQYQPVAGQQPSGMDLAWQALSDFRYQTLASTVELHPDGKVLLQVKLHGFNPKLQQGRPVHFNINLEEDLPALLTSLQLSGQISDKVRQRIQSKLQQQALQKKQQ